MTGLVAIEPVAGQRMAPPEPAPGSLRRAQVIHDLALDLHGALCRQGRAPFVLSGLPLFDDLQALRQTLAACLALAEDPTLRQWQTVLDQVLPGYEAAFADISQALAWVEQIKTHLDRPWPTDTEPGLGGDAVALDVAHLLGPLADLTDLSPWLAQFRDDLLALSERYWSGLFHCYTIVGLAPHQQRPREPVWPTQAPTAPSVGGQPTGPTLTQTRRLDPLQDPGHLAN